MSDIRRDIITAEALCSSCGACQADCPVYRATRREKTSARAKLRVAAAVAGGDLHADAVVRGMLDACLLCGRCTAACPNGVDAAGALTKARAVLAEQGAGHPGRAALLGGVLARPERLGALADLASRLAGGKSGLLLRLAPLEGLEKLPLLPRQSFLAQGPDVVPGPAGAPVAAFFAGCLANHLRPELARRAVSLLARRYTVIIPRGQGCCGLMARSSGALEAARAMERANREAFRGLGAGLVVTVCDSCRHALGEELGGAPVREICDVLTDNPPPAAGAERPVLVHAPCHLPGRAAPPAASLLRAAGLEPRAVLSDCCGGGGLFSLDNPGISGDIFEPARAGAMAEGGVVVATTCGGCWLQWRRGLPPSQNVCHPVELLGLP